MLGKAAGFEPRNATDVPSRAYASNVTFSSSVQRFDLYLQTFTNLS